MFTKWKWTSFFLAPFVLIITSCGDLKNKEVVKRELDGSQFSVQCQLEIDQFSKILEENIGSQIRCLGENLELFVRVVKSDREGYLSRKQLENYLVTHRPDVNPEMVSSLKAIFDLGHLITGEDPRYISKDTIQKVINFALVFNKEAALHYGPIFKNKFPSTYALHLNHRQRVSAANKTIIQEFRKIFKTRRGGEIHKLDILKLLESFLTQDSGETLDKAKKILFLKKLIIGGDAEIITHKELGDLILNFDQIILIGLDIFRYPNIILKQNSLIKLLERDVYDFYDIIHQGDLNNRDNDILFTLEQAIEAAKLFVDKDTFDLDKFEGLIGEAKYILLKGAREHVTGLELKNLFQQIKDMLGTGIIFHRIFETFKFQLENPRRVEETINFDEYRYSYPEHQEELNQFERIVKKYRFFKGEFLSSYYLSGFKRNADGIFQIALLEYGIKLVFQEYGRPSPNDDAVGGFSINQDQMRELLRKFEKELIELDLILPGRVTLTADNISLLGTLFAYQSDENEVMDVNEATEFAVALMSSLNISKDIFDYLETQNCSFDEYNRVDPSCFKDHFWRGLCTFYDKNFPLMFESLNFSGQCQDLKNTPESENLLVKSVLAARSCNYYTDGNQEEIPFSKGDVMSLMLALMHAETTMIRWDENKNNILDPEEVDQAYRIYSPALDGFMESMSPVIQKFKKPIFKYLIKHERVPDPKDFGSIWKFVKFLVSFKKNVPANRKTIVSILYEVGQQNKKLPGTPQFECNLLRDPENIPSEFEPLGGELRSMNHINIEDRLRVQASLRSPSSELFNASFLSHPSAETRKIFSLIMGEINQDILGHKDQIFYEIGVFSHEMLLGNVASLEDMAITPQLKKIFQKVIKNASLMGRIEKYAQSDWKFRSMVEKMSLMTLFAILSEHKDSLDL